MVKKFIGGLALSLIMGLALLGQGSLAQSGQEDFKEAEDLAVEFLQDYWLAAEEVSFEDFKNSYLRPGSQDRTFYREIENRLNYVNEKARLISDDMDRVVSTDLEVRGDIISQSFDDKVIVSLAGEKFYIWLSQDDPSKTSRISCDPIDLVFVFAEDGQGGYYMEAFVDSQSSPEYLASLEPWLIDFLEEGDLASGVDEPGDQGIEASWQEYLQGVANLCK